MTAHVQVVCEHPDRPHTIMYWLDDPNDPIFAPYVLTYDTMPDALETAGTIIRKTMARPEGSVLSWVKVFRADNEVYTCYTWTRDTTRYPMPQPPERAIQKRSTPSDTSFGRRSLWRRLLRR